MLGGLFDSACFGLHPLRLRLFAIGLCRNVLALEYFRIITRGQ